MYIGRTSNVHTVYVSYSCITYILYVRLIHIYVYRYIV